MLSKLHPDAAKVLSLGGFLASDPVLELDIGKQVRFKDWTPDMGTLKRDYTFTIIGVQRIYTGEIAYRVTCDGFDDTFGCPALPGKVNFVTC